MNELMKIKFNLGGKSRGSTKISAWTLFKPNFVGKTFTLDYSNRTEIVRLFMNAFKERADWSKGEKSAIGHFLSRWALSKVEKKAIKIHIHTQIFRCKYQSSYSSLKEKVNYLEVENQALRSELSSIRDYVNRVKMYLKEKGIPKVLA